EPALKARNPPLPLNLAEYEAAARSMLPAGGFAYVSSGAADEVTLRDSRLAYGRWRLLPRVLRGVAGVSLATTVLGQAVTLPVLLGPAAAQRLMHPEGELASARAARRAGTLFVMSSSASYPYEEIAAVAGPWWFQLTFYR